MERSNKLPTFLIIGVQKAGTTSIYHYLKQHPQIYMGPKETNFLFQDWEKYPPQKKQTKPVRTFERYCELFENVGDELAIGDVSPNCLFNYQRSTEAILRYVPNAQIIVILRNPAERAYSEYLMHVRDGDLLKSKSRNLSEQIKYRANQSHTLLKGLYYLPLQYLLEKFNREQIQIYLYEDLRRDSVKFMQDMYEFIGVDSRFIPNVANKYQVAAVPKVEKINRILQKRNPLRTFFASSLRLVLPLEKRQAIRSYLIKSNYKQKEKSPSLSPELRQELIDYYREDILKLQDLLQKDLSSWLTV
jgi:hypothetical protein